MTRDAAGSVRPDGYVHRALFYDSPSQLVDALVPFVQDGIAGDEHVVVVIDHDSGVSLLERLGSPHGFDLVDSTTMYTHPAWTMAGYIAAVGESTKSGRPMRVAGEPIWEGRSRLEIEEWTCVEAACNVAFHGAPLTMLCPYDLTRLDPSIVAAARRTHPLIQRHAHIAANAEFTAPATYRSDVQRRPLEPALRSAQVRAFASQADLAELRAFVYAFARVRSVPETRSLDFATAVNEIATNTIENAVGTSTVQVWSVGSQVFCDVTSAGVIPAGFAALIPPSNRQLRGRGIWLAGQLCDLIAIREHDGATTVRLQIATTYD